MEKLPCGSTTRQACILSLVLPLPGALLPFPEVYCLPFKVAEKLLSRCCCVSHVAAHPQGAVTKQAHLLQVVPTAWPEGSLHASMGWMVHWCLAPKIQKPEW